MTGCQFCQIISIPSASDNLDMDIPAHEEEDECNNADDADNDSNPNKHSCCSEGRRQNCSKIIQSASAHLSSILAEIMAIIKDKGWIGHQLRRSDFRYFNFLQIKDTAKVIWFK